MNKESSNELTSKVKVQLINECFTNYVYKDGKAIYHEQYNGFINHNLGELFRLQENKSLIKMGIENSSVRKGVYKIYKIDAISTTNQQVARLYYLKRKDLLSRLKYGP